jgi:ribosomal protein S18 acetylase RimI-like enzyme
LITIRRIQIGEAELFKRIRLLALQDAPYAFPSTYESALQRSDDSWREQAEGTALGAGRATFIAFSNDMPIGMTALYRDNDNIDVGELLQVWVSPEYRGTTVAKDLMDTIIEWAEENNFRKVIAGVTKANARALKFYIKYGFSILRETSEGVYLVKEVKRE